MIIRRNYFLIIAVCLGFCISLTNCGKKEQANVRFGQSSAFCEVIPEHKRSVKGGINPDEAWNVYAIHMKEQGIEPQTLKLYFPSAQKHSVCAISSDNILLGRWEYTDGNHEVSIPARTETIYVNVTRTEAEEFYAGLDGEEKAVADTPFQGKHMSVIADSISAYNGYIPEECQPCYSKGDDKGLHVTDMWWYQTARTLGMELCVVNASSGSGVTHLSGDRLSERYYDQRPELLHTAYDTPDVIFSWLGGNDINDGVAPGVIALQYCNLVAKLQNEYPDAEIYLITYYPIRYWSQTTPGEIKEMIRQVADQYGVHVIDTSSCEMARQEETYMVDSLHPNAAGQKLLSELIVSQLEAIGAGDSKKK